MILAGSGIRRLVWVCDRGAGVTEAGDRVSDVDKEGGAAVGRVP